MKILILGAGKMGSFFCDLLSFDHEVAVFDPDPQRLKYTFNCYRFSSLDEIKEFNPELVLNCATVKY
ncbi:MAG: prephenate dehydrogenase/arogenate dehydrogenase family protein, partial [Muribaculaceae bacterium]|nr:prephenate dehydrogenase/arogenate dehydrogenase family protein [Muribaculaceae bacterium]